MNLETGAPEFDAEAATAAAEAADPAGRAVARPGPLEAPAPAAPLPAPSPGGTEAPIAAQAVVQYCDQTIWALTKRRAKKAGIYQQLTADDRSKLRMTEADKEELYLATPAVLPALSKYADLIEKVGLGLFAFALWGIYEDKRDLVDKAAEIARSRSKPSVGFGTKPENGAAPDPQRGIRPFAG